MTDRSEEHLGDLIRSTNTYGYRYGHDNPWGRIVGFECKHGRLCYTIKFKAWLRTGDPTDVIDYWPVIDDNDPYAFEEIPKQDIL